MEIVAQLLLGRQDELEWLIGELDSGTSLVTLTGSAGIGKTSLARAFAAGFRADALFCEASLANDADGVCSAVARALEMPLSQELSYEARVQTLGNALQRYRVVVLDNVEQVLDDAATLLRAWSRKGPLFVVTSRTSLGLRHEKLLELRPLSLDAAVTLFEERASRLRPDFDLESVRSVVETIVNELDRVPLAIELAAGRSRVLDPHTLLERLQDRFRILRSRERDSPWPALEQAIAWSWQLLDPREQAMAAACTVFRGRFDVDAAERVLPGEDVLEILEALRDKSMLVARGRERLEFGMLSSIRAFCEDKLSPEERHVLFARHAEFFSAIARRYTSNADVGHLPSVRVLSERQEDLQAVVERQLHDATNSGTVACECVLALVALVETEGLSSALETTFENVVARFIDEVPKPYVAHLHLERSTLRRLHGRLDESRADAEHALALADPKSALAARATRRLGMLDVDIGSTGSALVHFERSIKLYQALDDERGVGVALSSMVRALYAEARLEEAERICLDALRLHRNGELGIWEGLTHGYLAYIYMDRAQYHKAEEHVALALERFRVLGSASYLAAFTGLLGTLNHLQGNLEDALVHFRQARETMTQSGRRRLAAIQSGNEGIVLIELQRPREANRALSTALAELQEVGDEARYKFFAAHAAGCAITLGDVKDARARLENAPGLQALERDVLQLQRAKLTFASQDEGEEARLNAERTLEAFRNDSRADICIALREVVRFRDQQRRLGDDVLRMGPDGARFEFGGEVVDLRGRDVLARMLVALAEAQFEGREGLSPPSLIAATWPEEKMSEASAMRRLHSTVRRLRKMGLSDILLHAHGKYRIRSDVRVVFE